MNNSKHQESRVKITAVPRLIILQLTFFQRPQQLLIMSISREKASRPEWKRNVNYAPWFITCALSSVISWEAVERVLSDKIATLLSGVGLRLGVGLFPLMVSRSPGSLRGHLSSNIYCLS